MKIPKAYITIGIPGSGKTTWINNQEWFKDCEYISTDKFVEEYAFSQNKTYSEVFYEYMPVAVNLMTNQVIEARNQNKDIVWDQTSTTIISRKKKFNLLPNYYHIAIVFKTPIENELIKRISSRPGKTIPWEIVSRMIKDFQIPCEDEGFKEIWFVN